MGGVKDCPKCGLVNPPDAQRCDCGYDFVTRTVEESYLGKRDPRADNLTLAETALVIAVPVFGLFIGVVARSQGRRRAGNMMILAAAAMIAVPLAIYAAYFASR
jgi:hypothetical protein